MQASIRSERLAWLGLFFFLCGGIVWVRTATVKATYQFVRHERELTDLGGRIQALRIRWLELTAPSRLEALARQFNLRPPTPAQRAQYPSTRKAVD